MAFFSLCRRPGCGSSSFSCSTFFSSFASSFGGGGGAAGRRCRSPPHTDLSTPFTVPGHKGDTFLTYLSFLGAITYTVHSNLLMMCKCNTLYISRNVYEDVFPIYFFENIIIGHSIFQFKDTILFKRLICIRTKHLANHN